MKNKVVSPEEAAAVIRDGDTVSVSGFVGIGTPDELILAIENRFLGTQQPKDLTLVFTAAPGDGKDRGLNHLAHRGLVKRAVGGHWALLPKLCALALDESIEAYNLPLGCLAIGRKVALIVNYDGFTLDPAVSNTYCSMVAYLQQRHYATASRYTTSAFMRLKLGASLADHRWPRTCSRTHK